MSQLVSKLLAPRRQKRGSPGHSPCAIMSLPETSGSEQFVLLPLNGTLRHARTGSIEQPVASGTAQQQRAVSEGFAPYHPLFSRHFPMGKLLLRGHQTDGDDRIDHRVASSQPPENVAGLLRVQRLEHGRPHQFNGPTA